MLNKKLKTHRRMPPQSAAPEGRSVDKARVPPRNGAGHTAACQQGREERMEQVSSIPSPTRRCGAGVSPLQAEDVPPKKQREAMVFVLDRHGFPLMPCCSIRARRLLALGRAVVVSELPFTIRIKDRVGGDIQPIQYKIDPGSKTTGIALVREELGNCTKQTVLYLAELKHRSQVIHKHMLQRSQHRRRRRSANLRYRKKRFNNRKKEGLPPSLQSRVDNITTQLLRYRRIAPITSIHIEHVRFDMQAMQNPDIQAEEYQRGTLYGFEIREYLLEKWGRKCAYCDAKDTPLNLDHIVPKSKGGSDRISNLTLACVCCNQNKGSQSIDEFLSKDAKRLKSILSHTKVSLKDAAAVNATRNTIVEDLTKIGLPTFTAGGGRTKFNRSSLGIPKTHALDAACVGEVLHLHNTSSPVLHIEATGRGSYQRTRVDSFGFPRGYLVRKKRVFGFQTGDRIYASVRKGKKTGVYTGRVAVRSSGSFNIQTDTGVIQGISWKDCRLKARANGYNYTIQKTTNKQKEEHAFLPPLNRGVSGVSKR